jgi:putative endopeptidase
MPLKIGYPDKWIDYDSLSLAIDEPFLHMVLKAREFENELEIKEINAPTDRAKWHMTPQTVNAYYHPSLNEIVFPAGKYLLVSNFLASLRMILTPTTSLYCKAILQHPFFDKDADDAVNCKSQPTCFIHIS